MRPLAFTGASTLLAVLFAGAAHAAGMHAYVGNFSDNTVSVVDIDRDTVVATIPVATGPHGMVASPDGRTVYVAGDGASEVDAIDTASHRVRQAITVGRTPHGLALTRDGRWLLVALYGEDRVAFVDTATRAVVASVPVAKPHTIAIRPDGKVAYAASQAPGAFALVVIDLDARAVRQTIALEKTPRDLEFADDGSALYFTQAGVDAVLVLDPASDRIVARIPTGASPHVAGVYRGAPAGTVVVQGPGEVQLFDPATNAPLRRIAVGKQPHWIATFGAMAAVTDEGSDDVTIVDLASGDTRRIAVGKAPRKVVVVPAVTPSAASTSPAASASGSATEDGMSALPSPGSTGPATTAPATTAPTTTAPTTTAPTTTAPTTTAPTTSGPASTVAKQADASPAAAAASPAQARIAIAQFAFSPAVLTVARGTTVTWTNDDAAPHGLHHRDGAPGENLLLPGASASRVYDRPGTYEYECAVHSYMTGKVVVSGD